MCSFNLIILQINDLNDLKSKTAPLPNISAFDFHGNYCYNLCSLSLHIMYVEICIHVCAHGPYGLLHE